MTGVGATIVEVSVIPWTGIFMALFAAVLSFVSAYFWYKKNESARTAREARRTADSLAARTALLEQELVALKTAVVPISAAFQAILIKELTHYHTPVMDRLLEKLGPPVTLTPAEEVQLTEALQERTRDMDGAISESERDAAVMLPLVIKRVKSELLSTNPAVQLVAVPTATNTDEDSK